MENMICNFCGYSWEARVEKPKKCARCLRWIKYNVSKKEVALLKKANDRKSTPIKEILK